ncbi:glycoside hydrolase [Fomitiporia mediterranea MF3/22]|uniref:glycoside hydrolase n=1 Tax=Fomitiporia mediterranea (strain MF3/22) TaxID=694068 RepID=UPI00044091C0|nr:glycoside hydrolase [Fomitiporia mediterranea MF3/22]EJD03463.1 glycoside hydrolase [Fomitiporia mediterranea MF3/22]
MVSSAWYTGWHAQDFTLDDVPWNKYTHLTYAFRETTQDPSNITLPEPGARLLPQFVAKAHENGVKAFLSLGGWTGSQYFSTNVGNEKNRTKFVNAINELVSLYHLDGIDFDWESPGHQGIGCNTISPNDTANFLSLLQELRRTPTGSSITISAAVGLTPFADETGQPSTNVTGFAKVIDYIEIMNYDVWGSWSTSVGPNAPLNDTCASAEHQQGSAVSAVAAWTAAGMPPNQIVLGVASYGHSFAVNASSAFNGTNSKTELAPYPAFNASEFPVGDAWDDQPSIDICGVFEQQGGEQDFWNLVDSGMLLPNGTPAPNTPYRFDDCSQTDYVYNTTASVMISYDGPRAFAAKGEFIKNVGLRGFAMWEAGGDKNNTLLNAIRASAGFDNYII